MSHSIKTIWKESIIYRIFTLFFGNNSIVENSKFIKILSCLHTSKLSKSKITYNIKKILWVLLIVSASFSSKIYFDSIEGFFIKFDDIIFIFILAVSLISIKKWKGNKLDLPITFFIFICVASIFRGIFIGTVNSSILSIAYLLKIIQYFLFFYFLFNFLSDESEVKFYISAIFSVALLIGVYGIAEHFFPYKHSTFSYPFYYRIYERGFFYHDANHFAAYLMFISSLIFGIVLFLRKNILSKVVLSLVFLILCSALFWTYSRGAYIALFVSLLIVAGIRSRKLFIITLIFLLVLGLFFAPSSVTDRIYSIKDTFISDNPYSSSIAYRLQQIKYAWQTVKQYPLLGIGLAARSRVFYENQFVLLLSEVGILGLILFFTIVYQLFKTTISLFKKSGKNWIKGLSAGYIGGLTGLVILCNTLVVFLISRIMIPFWIVTALVFWLFIKYKKDERVYS